MVKRNKKKMCDCAAWSILPLRLLIGIVFLVHGLGKLVDVGPWATGGVAGFAGALAGLGVPLALFFAWVVTLVEVLGGAAVLLGVFNKYATGLLGLDMLAAFFLVHVRNGFGYNNGGYEVVLMLFLVLLSLHFSGPGEKWVLNKDWA